MAFRESARGLTLAACPIAIRAAPTILTVVAERGGPAAPNGLAGQTRIDCKQEVHAMDKGGSTARKAALIGGIVAVSAVSAVAVVGVGRRIAAPPRFRGEWTDPVEDDSEIQWDSSIADRIRSETEPR